MKYSIIILLILVLSSPFWGIYIFFHIERKNTRIEINEKLTGEINKVQVILLKFTEKDSKTRLKWKHDGEFEYKGQMYDIVKKHLAGDTTFYYCYKDNKETRLNSEMAGAIARTMGQEPCKKSQADRLTDFFKTLFQPLNAIWQANIPSSPSQHILSFIFHYSTLAPSPLSPPPKMG